VGGGIGAGAGIDTDTQEVTGFAPAADVGIETVRGIYSSQSFSEGLALRFMIRLKLGNRWWHTSFES
jgi:hypothetical protein